ncbi:hypothetical protein ACFYV5_06190 [Streptomyces sp. NPDC003035]|uniref:hypothetical protein n=1 Tax=Streptomyces sp. NPDC003035 TaxID=3364676 RepID=UPI00368A710A
MFASTARRKRGLHSLVTIAVAAASVLAVTACGPGESADSSGAPSPTTSASTPAAAEPSPSGSSDGKGAKSPQQQVDAFLKEYKAAADNNDTAGKLKAKKDYVILQYQPQLAEWEAKNSADGVFRAQNVPVSFVTKTDEGRTTQDSVFVIATFQWSNADGTRVEYQVDRQDLKIRNILELD